MQILRLALGDPDRVAKPLAQDDNVKQQRKAPAQDNGKGDGEGCRAEARRYIYTLCGYTMSC